MISLESRQAIYKPAGALASDMPMISLESRQAIYTPAGALAICL